jgi:Fe2+ or Zn2+ uptake regulation protein
MFYICLDCGQITERKEEQIKIFNPRKDHKKIDWDNLKPLDNRTGNSKTCNCEKPEQSEKLNQAPTNFKLQNFERYQNYKGA